MNGEELLEKRLFELAMRSYNTGTFCFSDFLGLSEQAVFQRVKKSIHGIKYTEFGGTEGAERIMLRFGDPDELGYEEPFPIVCIKAAPRAAKFADKLTHRDFLGALMNLGIERETLGDIPILDNIGYIFAKEKLAPFIIESLTRVKHTDLALSITENIPEGELYRTEPITVQIASERIDAVISKALGLSRDDSQALIARGLVFASGKLIESASYAPKISEIISVRGHGRLIYRGAVSTSKKGKLNVRLDIYK